MEQLSRQFATPAVIKAVQAAISDRSDKSDRSDRSDTVHLVGLNGSAAAMLFSRLKRGHKPFIVIGDDLDDAGYLFHDLSALCAQRGERRGEERGEREERERREGERGEEEESASSDYEAVKFFPSGYRRDIKYGQPDAPARILRTEALQAWADGHLRFLVTCPEALAEVVPAAQEVQQARLVLKKGQDIPIKDVRARLLELGFTQTDYVYEPGQFAVRGSIVDVYSYACEQPYRIDFFDTEIDSIRNFDVETQISSDTSEVVTILPDMVSKGDAGGISLLDFVGTDTVLLCRDPEYLLQRIDAIAAGTLAAEVNITGEGDADAMSRVVNPTTFRASLRSHKIITFRVGASDAKAAVADDAPVIRFDTAPQTLYHKNFDMIAEDFSRFLDSGYKIYLLSDSSAQAERLHAIFSDTGEERKYREKNLDFTPVSPTLHAGFVDHDSKSCFFTDHQIFDRFHRYNLRSERARGGKLAMSLRELQKLEPGDFVVHADHGIGRFGGLVRTDVAGKTQEMIKLYYQNDDIIFVSIHSLHKLSKYRSSEGETPRLSKLGSGAWQRLKDRTKAKVKDMARDLIALYSQRQKEKGFAFSADTYMQHELEASFLYEDTPDQLSATRAIKADMQSPRPMDRLVCGDVGFGKTELAVRAAFKAAVDGKQTAVLVPTTVLAMQHYHTFSDRLREMPVRVDFLSRARKPKEVKQILADLQEGKIDIIIGTHKLIGKSVKFHDLGLLVIDEEQKFGVAVKEKLRQLRVNVDTLTLSATPIPRTLQFSLMGARDLSNLDTPPANRRPVATNVTPLSDDTVREAVNFELSRSGQVFFITPRIERLDLLENMLRRLVPDARMVRAHGQMPPERVEKAILDFAAHDYDILLSTTIVENGIDMPNVNTILIDSAHRFGLSELHQLRGRVGRSDRKAFAYLLVPPGAELTPVARRRLQTIESYSGLGAGIQIAMQDLDIRGAGNLLGSEQSGFIADLGYEVYQRILKEAVVELRTQEFPDLVADEKVTAEAEYIAETTVETDMELLIPVDYVPQEAERITLYRRLDAMDTDTQAEEFRAMLRDRFGAIPQQTLQLIDIVPLRAAARRLGVERLHLKGGKMYLYFPDADNEAYYRSPAFGRFISYFQVEPARTKLRDLNARRSMLVTGVESVSEALDIVRRIASLPSA